MSDSEDSSEDEAQLARDDELRRQRLAQFYGAAAASPSSAREPLPVAPQQNKSRPGQTQKDDSKKTVALPGGLEIKLAMPSTRAVSALAQDFGHLATAGLIPSADASTPKGKEQSAFFPRGKFEHSTPLPKRSEAVESLDNASFDALAYARTLLQTKSASELLAIEDSLAHSVKTLDSSMQTLVYENYSKFIDATDAIRAIGTSVGTRAQKMDDLMSRIEAVDKGAKEIDSDLRACRTDVKEKLRVRRQLERIDALLKLPLSLEKHVEKRHYKAAADAWAVSRKLLDRHSKAAPALAKIYDKCEKIIATLHARLWHTLGKLADSDGRDDDDDDEGHAPLPDPRPSCKFVFHLASAIKSIQGSDDRVKEQVIRAAARILHAELREKEREEDERRERGDDDDDDDDDGDDGNNGNNGNDNDDANGGNNNDDDDDDDDDDRRGGGSDNDSDDDRPRRRRPPAAAAAKAAAPSPKKEHKRHGVDFLASVSKAATYCADAFPMLEGPGGVPVDPHLSEFISKMYSSYLHSTQARLFARCDDLSPTAAKSLANDLNSLIADAQVFAKAVGAAVGLPSHVTNRYKDKSYEVANAVVNRRIAARYSKLREKALAELTAHVMSLYRAKGTPANTTTSSSSSSSSSTDETTRELCQAIHKLHHEALLSFVALTAAPVDPTVLNVSIHAQARTFVLWVASSFEVAAGSSAGGAPTVVGLNNNEDKDGDADASYDRSDRGSSMQARQAAALEPDSFDVDYSQLRAAAAKARSEPGSTLPLAMAEACRFACDIIPEKASDSIARLNRECANISGRPMASPRNASPRGRGGGGGGGRQESFGDDATATDVDHDGAATLRFRIAGTRILSLFAMDLGVAGANALCVGLKNKGMGGWAMGDREPRDPREGVRFLLSIARNASLACAEAFGGPKRACPAAVVLATKGREKEFAKKAVGGGKSYLGGFALDVERMFSEKIAVFGNVEFSRESVVLGVFKVAIKSLLELARVATFSRAGYQQVQIDVLVLRHLLPHYLGEVAVVENLLDDVLVVVGGRCAQPEILEVGVSSAIVNRWLEREGVKGRNDEKDGFIMWDDI